MKSWFYFLVLANFLLFFSACHKGEKVDFIVHNAKIYISDDGNTETEALAISKGKIVDFGAERYILNKYRSDEYLDANSKEIYPTFSLSGIDVLAQLKQPDGIDFSQNLNKEQVLVELEKSNQFSDSKLIFGVNARLDLFKRFDANFIKCIDSIYSMKPVVLQNFKGDSVFCNSAFLEQFTSGFSGLNSKNKSGFFLKNEEIASSINKAISSKDLAIKLIEFQKQLFSIGCSHLELLNVDSTDLSIIKQNSNKIKIDLSVYLKSSNSIMQIKRNTQQCVALNLTFKGFSFLKDSIGFSLASSIALKNNKQLVLDESVVSSFGFPSFEKRMKAVQETKSDHRWRILSAEKLDSSFQQKCIEFGFLLQFNELKESVLKLGNSLTAKRKERLGNQWIFSFWSNLDISQLNFFQEIEALQNRGFTQAESAKVYMRNSAYFLREDKKIGTLEKRKQANFIILDRPMSHGSSKTSIKATYLNGKCVYKI